MINTVHQFSKACPKVREYDDAVYEDKYPLMLVYRESNGRVVTMPREVLTVKQYGDGEDRANVHEPKDEK